MEHSCDEIIEQLDSIRVSLENQTNYAVIWLAETIDFLTNRNLEMGAWAYTKYLEALNSIDMDTYSKVSKVLQKRLLVIKDTSD